jgi:hypothetical protein
MICILHSNLGAGGDLDLHFFVLLHTLNEFLTETTKLLYTVKKGFAVFPSPAGMSLTKLFLDGNMFPLLSMKFSLSQAGILTESF